MNTIDNQNRQRTAADISILSIVLTTAVFFVVGAVFMDTQLAITVLLIPVLVAFLTTLISFGLLLSDVLVVKGPARVGRSVGVAILSILLTLFALPFSVVAAIWQHHRLGAIPATVTNLGHTSITRFRIMTPGEDLIMFGDIAPGQSVTRTIHKADGNFMYRAKSDGAEITGTAFTFGDEDDQVGVNQLALEVNGAEVKQK